MDLMFILIILNFVYGILMFVFISLFDFSFFSENILSNVIIQNINLNSFFLIKGCIVFGNSQNFEFYLIHIAIARMFVY